jgi:hypothetical protein
LKIFSGVTSTRSLQKRGGGGGYQQVGREVGG